MNDELRGMHDETIFTAMSAESLLERALREEREDLEIARRSPLWPSAVAFLAGHFTAAVALQIRQVVESKSPDWPAAYHSFWGMGVRNALRNAGFGERELGVRNLDNVYVELVEEAVR